MNGMSGNSHAQAAQKQLLTDNEALIESVLALAHEQRTLALIAYAQQADDETADQVWDHIITPRLGLDEGE